MLSDRVIFIRILANSQVFLILKRPDQICCHPTYPRLIYRVPDVFSLDQNWPQRVADHSPSPSAEIRNEWSHTSTHLYSLMALIGTALPHLLLTRETLKDSLKYVHTV